MALQQRSQPDIGVLNRKIAEASSAGYLEPIIWWLEQEIERMSDPMPISDELWPLKRAFRDGNKESLQRLKTWIGTMSKPPEGA